MSNPSLREKLGRFALDAAGLRMLRGEFQLALASCDFREPREAKSGLTLGHGTPGVYFWVVRAWNRHHRLYIGQTTSLSYRVSNYLSPFQPNATNDFKLRICHDLIVAEEPSACFDLYFAPLKGVRRSSPKLRPTLREAEKSALDRFGGALVNQRGMAPSDAKDRLRLAYEAFYRENLLSVLNSL